jgi:hypothetical protein
MLKKKEKMTKKKIGGGSKPFGHGVALKKPTCAACRFISIKNDKL